MKNYALKMLLFTALFLVYDKTFIIIRYYSAEKEIDKRLEYLINGKINKDLIITGSSRGSRDILASQIEDQTGLSSYNLCYPGSNVEFHEFLIKALLTFNKAPSVILLVVDDPEELLVNETVIYRKDRLYPLVKYPYIRDELVRLGDKDKLLSDIIILHQLNKYNFDLRQKKFTPLDTIIECGSMPISWQQEGRDWRYHKEETIYKIDNENIVKINAYKEIIKTCESRDIKLVIVFPPNYHPHNKAFEDRIRHLSGEKNYFYVYNTNNSIYKNKDYYYDQAHLMRKGAVDFTNELIDYLSELCFIPG